VAPRLRWIFLFGLAVGIGAAAVALAVARPWPADDDGAADELMVERATLLPGRIVLVLVNGSNEVARLAQVIVNDAYVDFRAGTRAVGPDAAGRITVSYPWIQGESYEIELLMSPQGAVEYGIEEAEAGSQSAEAA
jgi:hypothetical protein